MIHILYPFVIFFDKTYEQYKRLVYKICFQVLKDRELAADAMQETFIMVYKKRNVLNDIPSFKYWICKTAHNKAVDIAVKNSRPYVDYTADLKIDRYINPERSVLVNECIQEILQEIQNMNPRYVEVLNLHIFHELKAAQIVELLDIPLDTVNTRIRRGMEILRTRVQKKFGGFLNE